MQLSYDLPESEAIFNYEFFILFVIAVWRIEIHYQRQYADQKYENQKRERDANILNKFFQHQLDFFEYNAGIGSAKAKRV